MIEAIKKINFYLIIFLLPLNLGLHFIFNSSYVRGLLVDYLIPTIYIQDILVLLFIVFTGLSVKKSQVTPLLHTKFFAFLVLFLFSVFLSALNAENILSSVYAFIRLFLYMLFSLSTVLFFCQKKDFALLVKVLSTSVFLVSFLGLLQWLYQGSVFDNYRFFGEQPYNFSTWGIVRDNFFGVTKIPVYGLFRHPNIFAGFLVVILIWMLVLVPENKFTTASFILGLLALFFTLNYYAWAVFILSTLMIFIPRRFSIITIFVVLVAALFFPLINTNHASVQRRSELLERSYEIISYQPLFGVGLNNFVLYSPETRFLQPTHNIFILVFAESGVFSFVFFMIVLYLVLKIAWQKKILLVSFVAMLILSSFDHYFYTIHQTQLLFWLTVGIIYSYNIGICATKS